MKVLVTGGAGFVGLRLVKELLRHGSLNIGAGKVEPITEVTILEVALPAMPLPEDKRLKYVVGDVSDVVAMRKIIDMDTKVIFHFAAVVSGMAEKDLELGLRINVDGTRTLLNVCKELGTCPKFIFSSSIGVYGGELPSVVTDQTPLTPQTSYGMEKVCCEYIINDYHRRGHVEGWSIRLGTIVIRPGKPNAGVGQWTSSIIREPLTGLQAICPVKKDTRLVVMSIQKLVENLIHLCTLKSDALDWDRTILLPGLSVTVIQILEALERAGGKEAVKCVQFVPDAFIQSIYDHWPQYIDGMRAKNCGILADHDFDAIIQGFIRDDLEYQKRLVEGLS